MRLIARSAIDRWAADYGDAAKALEAWAVHAERATWQSIIQVRATYPTADAVTVRSGRVVTVFNIRGNNYRLITAIHYDGGRVYLMQFLTHKEYDTDKWKDEL